MPAFYKYRVKGEFKALFANLGRGEALDATDVFSEPEKPVRKSITGLADIDKNERHEQLLQKLVDAGFVEAIERKPA